MHYLAASLFLFMTNAAFAIDASDLVGSWSGRGSCYLQRRPGIASVCDYTTRIVIRKTLYIRTCAVWQQEWGNGHDCWESEYEIRNSGELWKADRFGHTKVGSLRAKDITVEYETEDVSVSESFRLEGDKLKMRSDYRASGKQWLYLVDLAKTPL